MHKAVLQGAAAVCAMCRNRFCYPVGVLPLPSRKAGVGGLLPVRVLPLTAMRSEQIGAVHLNQRPRSNLKSACAKQAAGKALSCLGEFPLNAARG